MTDPFAEEYARFARERLRPAITEVSGRKRSGLLSGVIAGLVVFVVGAFAVYALLSPYREFIPTDTGTFWPLMLLAPAALGILAFSLVFVLSLRRTVVCFREALVASMAEFIDPALVHENAVPLSEDRVTASHLFSTEQKVLIGQERFRGRSGEATAEFADIRVKDDIGAKAVRRGIFFVAHYERPFPYPFFIFPAGVSVSRSGLETALTRDGYEVAGGLVRVEQGGRQYLVPSAEESNVGHILSPDIVRGLTELTTANGGELYLSGRDNDLYLAILPPTPVEESAGIFEGFDYDACREFCRDAKFAMTVARKGGELRGGITRHFLS